MNKKGNNYTLITLILFALTILSYILINKSIYLDINHILETKISSIIYAFTFLFTAILYKKSNFNKTHTIILKTIYSIIIFIFIITLLNNINSTTDTVAFDIALKHIFTPSNIILNNITFYYPNILNLILFLLLFYFSQTILVLFIEALEPYTNRFMAFYISMFIPYTLYLICYGTFIDIFNKASFNIIISHLTSNFIISIIFTLIISLTYKKNKL